MVVPPATPVTTPDNAPTVATPVALLVHVPPDEASVSAVVEPAHIEVTPVGVDGTPFTVMLFVAEQPSLSE